MLLNGAVEGLVDQAILLRLLRDTRHEPAGIYGLRGKQDLLKKLDAYNRAAAHFPWAVLVDLDGDAQCAPEFVARHLPSPAPQMTFRVAVREAEAWLLADRRAFARFLGVSQARLPKNADLLKHPKRFVVDLARGSAKRSVRDGIVPRPRARTATGPGYVSQIIEFVTSHWQPRRAAARSESLSRCLHRLETLHRAPSP